MSMDAEAQRLTDETAFHPSHPGEPDGLPCLEVGGAVVFAYVKAATDTDGVERLRLHVSIHLDGADALTHDDAMGIPVRVALDGAQLDVDHRGSWSLEAQGTYGLTLTPAGG